MNTFSLTNNLLKNLQNQIIYNSEYSLVKQPNNTSVLLSLFHKTSELHASFLDRSDNLVDTWNEVKLYFDLDNKTRIDRIFSVCLNSGDELILENRFLSKNTNSVIVDLNDLPSVTNIECYYDNKLTTNIESLYGRIFNLSLSNKISISNEQSEKIFFLIFQFTQIKNENLGQEWYSILSDDQLLMTPSFYDHEIKNKNDFPVLVIDLNLSNDFYDQIQNSCRNAEKKISTTKNGETYFDGILDFDKVNCQNFNLPESDLLLIHKTIWNITDSKIPDYFNVNGVLKNFKVVFLNYVENGHIWTHSDNVGFSEKHQKVFIKEPFNNFSCIFYLNDDFEGGNLVFPYIEKNGEKLEIVPKKGRMVIFPSNMIFSHQVTKITSGNRIAITKFMSVR